MQLKLKIARIAAATAVIVLSLPIAPSSAIAATSDKIVFYAHDGDTFEIFRMDADGTNRTQLTNSATETSAAPSISDDGTKVVYSSNTGGGATSDIYSMNIDGSSKTRLTTHFQDDEYPDWSPDGTKIAYVLDGAADEIWTMNADGTNKVKLTPFGATEMFPAWSPDGTKIAFVGLTPIDVNSSQWDIYVMNADGTGRTQLTENVNTDQQPAWSTDGSQIAFTSNRGGDNEIWVMNADGSGETQLTNDLNMSLNPSWGPNDKITFHSNRVSGSVGIYEMNGDGTNVVRISPSGASDNDPSRSAGTPDTTAPDAPTFTATSPASPSASTTPKIKGTAESGSTVRLYTNNSCTSAVVGSGTAAAFASPGLPVTVASGSTTTFYATATDSSNNTSPCSSTSITYVHDPGAGKITFTSDRDSSYEIFTMATDGSDVTQLTSDSSSFLNYESSWSPDGSKIVWTRHSNAVTQSDLWTMNADGSNKTQLTFTANPFREHHPEWSPDGTKIAYYNYNDTNDDIWVINADGTGNTRLTTSTGRKP